MFMNPMDLLIHKNILMNGWKLVHPFLGLQLIWIHFSFF